MNDHHTEPTYSSTHALHNLRLTIMFHTSSYELHTDVRHRAHRFATATLYDSDFHQFIHKAHADESADTLHYFLSTFHK